MANEVGDKDKSTLFNRNVVMIGTAQATTNR